MYINLHVRHGMGNCKIRSWQIADALQKLLCDVDPGIGDAGGIEHYVRISPTIYYRDVFKCIPFTITHHAL